MSSAFGKRKKSDGVDFYPTDPLWVDILCRHHKFKGIITEPACGDGAISEELKKHKYRVESTDKYDYGYGYVGRDFLDRKVHTDNIITNPPSFLFDEFWIKAYSLARHEVAFLFGSFILTSSAKRYKLIFEKTPPSKIIFIVNRMKVFGESSQFTHCWAIWNTKSKSKKTEAVWHYEDR